jgi:hypothetical protein
MSSGLTTIALQLGKLLPLLGSNHDGEVVATARAIRRLLQGTGHDWHDLVSALHLPAARSHACRDWRDDLAHCAATIDLLSEREREFLRSLAHWRGEPSPKQLDWLAAIASRLRGAA